MRDFNDKDRQKKRGRIQLPENPANLTPEKLTQLENQVKAALKEGHLPCGSAYRIADQAGVPRIAVGALTDKLGVRVSDCQIGCFKVDKTLHDDLGPDKADAEIAGALEKLKNEDKLTCANVHELARQMNRPPMALADVANLKGWKIRDCQLGCF